MVNEQNDIIPQNSEAEIEFETLEFRAWCWRRQLFKEPVHRDSVEQVNPRNPSLIWRLQINQI